MNILEYKMIDIQKENTQQIKNHSIIGSISLIISFILLIICVVFFLGVAANILNLERPDNKYLVLAIRSACIFYVLLNLTGTILGIVGMFQKNKYKILPLLGIIINGLILTLVVAMIISVVRSL